MTCAPPSLLPSPSDRKSFEDQAAPVLETSDRFEPPQSM